MSDFLGSLKGVASSEHAVGALYVGLIAFVLADSIPTPADSVTLTWQRNIRDKWKNNEISAASYWRQNILAYYIPNVVWWLIILIIVVNIPGGIRHKAYVAIAIIGAGIAVGLIYNLYRKDAISQAITNNA